MQLMNSQIQNMQMKNDAHPNPERRCYTVDELTQILGVGRKAVYSLIRKKAFPAIRISSIGYRIPKERKKAIPKPVIILLVITLVAGLALSGVDVLT